MASIVSSASSSLIDDNDPMTRDSFALRQRLLETERLLQNLTIKSSKVSVDLDSTKNTSGGKESVYQSDDAPVLTLADLTPTNSHNGDYDTNFGELHSETIFPRCSSFNNVEKIEDDRSSAGSRQSTLSNISLDSNSRGLHKKMKKLQEENVSLFIQNNKLLTELEKTSFQLQESKSQVKEFNDLIEENQELKENSTDEDIRSLQEQLENKDYAIRELEALVLELRDHLQTERNQVNRGLQEELDDNVKRVEELSDSCKGYSQREKQLQEIIEQLEETKKKNEKKINDLEIDNSALSEENVNVKADNLSLQEQLATLKSELLSSQHNSSHVNALTVENADLKSIVEQQQAKLTEYEMETSKANDHMAHLEKLIQKIQDDRVSNSRSENNTTGTATEVNKFTPDLDASSQRAIIADLNLKLAMKDTELHKLQTLVASNTLNQNKLKAEYNYEGSSFQDLRAELTSVVEKNRMRDKLHQQLEQEITKLEEDLNGKKCQIVEMNERLADKVSLSTTLESKLSQRNRKLVELQKELEDSIEKNEKCGREISKLTTEAGEQSKCLLEKESKLKDLEFQLTNATKNIKHLEGLIKSHEEETKETDTQFESVKQLHAEHCKEYEFQIETLQQQVTNKSKHVVTLETKLRNVLGEEKNRKTSVTELKEYINKMEQLLEEKKGVIEKYQQSLQSMQDHSKAKSQHVSDLQTSLEQYKKELADTMKQLQEARDQHESMAAAQKNQLDTVVAANAIMKEDVEAKTQHITNLEQSHNQNIEMLQQSQKHLSDLEELQGKNEREIASLKQTLEFSRGKYEEEATVLTTKVQEYKKQLSKYKDHCTKLTDELNVLKSNNIVIQAKCKEQEEKLSGQSDLIKNQADEMNKLNLSASEIEKYIREREGEIKRLDEELTTKNQTIAESLNTQRELTDQLSEAQHQLKDSLHRLSQLERDVKTKRKAEKDEATRKVERMLTISQEDLSTKEKDLAKKEKELSEYRERAGQMESIMNEQQWQLKQKAAEFAQMEISFKNEKSEFEKKIAFLSDDISSLRSSISNKDLELLELTKSNEALKIREEDKRNTIDIYEKKFQILEEENTKMAEEVKELSKELDKCKAEVKNRISLEEEVVNLKNDLKNKLANQNTLETQLMSSQQAVMELTQEVTDAKAMIKLKEADSTRLARELGVSQVREAQVNARLNQDMRKVVLEEGKKTTQKNNEIDFIRNKLNEVTTTSTQEIMQLKLSLQRSEDEKQLFKHDLERYTAWVNELDQNSKTLSEELQKERRKCKSLSESIVLQEAKAARYSTQMAGFKRAALKSVNLHQQHQQQKQQHQQHLQGQSPKSTIATDLTLDLDSTMNTLVLSPDSEALPLKDSFDQILKETEAALESPPNIHVDVDHGNKVVSMTTTPVKTIPFNISSFHVT